MTILYADDDSDDLTLFQEAIAEIDPSINCLLVSNGNKVLDILKAGISPDLIFLDVYMPEMDGINCLKQIRLNENFDNTKVVLLTVSPYLINKEKIKGLTIELLTKPNNYEDLVHMLTQTLSAKMHTNHPK